MAAMANYLRIAMEALENGESNTNLFASTGNQFMLNTCASVSEGEIDTVAPCGVCFLHYTKGGDRNPVMFFSEGCGHTVCKECFLKMRDIALRERKDITCPYCRKAVKRAACVRF
jgi:hypothetical protein